MCRSCGILLPTGVFSRCIIHSESATRAHVHEIPWAVDKCTRTNSEQNQTGGEVQLHPRWVGPVLPGGQVDVFRSCTCNASVF